MIFSDAPRRCHQCGSWAIAVDGHYRAFCQEPTCGAETFGESKKEALSHLTRPVLSDAELEAVSKAHALEVVVADRDGRQPDGSLGRRLWRAHFDRVDLSLPGAADRIARVRGAYQDSCPTA